MEDRILRITIKIKESFLDGEDRYKIEFNGKEAVIEGNAFSFDVTYDTGNPFDAIRYLHTLIKEDYVDGISMNPIIVEVEEVN